MRVEVDLKLLVKLGKYFQVLDSEEDTLCLVLKDTVYSMKEVGEMLLLLFELAPDEFSWETDHFRLWWD